MNISRGRTVAGSITTLALVFGALTALPAAATEPSVLNVSPTGTDSDNNNCVATACLTINYAIEQAAAGDTINVAAGIYSASVTVSKDVDIVGAGASGENVTQINGLITVSASGASVGNPLTLSGLRVTNSAGNGVNISNGASNISLQNIVITEGSAAGIDILGGTSTNTNLVLQDVDILSNGGTGIRMGSTVRVDGLGIYDSEISNNASVGFSYSSSQTSVSLTNVVIEDTVFFNNSAAVSQANNTGSGDISLFAFNGNVRMTRVSVSAPNDANLSQYAVQIAGRRTSPTTAGTVVLEDLTISGYYQRMGASAAIGGQGLVIADYTDVSNFSMSDVSVNTSQGHALYTWGLSTTLDLGNTSLRAQRLGDAAIVVGSSGFNNAKTVIDASDASIGGVGYTPVATSTASASQLATIADSIADSVDYGSTSSALTGHVYLRPNTIVVTPNSYVPGLTSAPSIQRAIDTAVAGDTVQVAAGTYAGEVVISKSNLTLAGAGQTQTLLVPSRNYASDNRGIAIKQASGLVIQDLTIDGAGNPVLAAGENFHDGIWWEGGGDNNTVRRVTVKNIDRRAISVFPETVKGTLISYVTVDNVSGAVSNPNGSEGIRMNGTGTVEYSSVSNARYGIGGTVDGDSVEPLRIVNNTVSNIRSWLSVGNRFSIGINYWMRSGSNPAIVEGNTISGSNAGGSGIYLVRPPAGSSISNNTITFTGENGIAIETGWSPNGQVEIVDNAISMGPKSSGIIATGMGLSSSLIEISGNTISNSSTLGVQTNDFSTYGFATSREVGLLISSGAMTSRTGDANSGIYANVLNNTVSGFTNAFVGIKGQTPTPRDFRVNLQSNNLSATGAAKLYGTLSGSGAVWAFSSRVPSDALGDFLARKGIDLDADTASFVPAEGTSISSIWVDETLVSGSLPWAGVGDSFVDIYAYSSPAFLGTAPVTNGSVQLNDLDVSGLSLGSHTLVFVGQTSEAAKAVSIAITKRPQVVTFSTDLEGPSMPLAGTFTVSASGGASGNPVSISPLSRAICRLASGVVTAIRPGACNLVANQTGNAVYAAGTASLSVDVVSPETRVPTFGRIIRYEDGFGFSISNYDPSWTYTQSIVDAPDGALIGRVGSFVTVEGLDPGQTVSVVVSNTKRFFTGSNATISGTALPPTLLEAVNPTLAAPTPTRDGFTVQIANFDPRWQYTATSDAVGALVRVTGTGLVQVTGLAASVTSTVTVGNTRVGYNPGSVTSEPISSLGATPLPVLGTVSYPSSSSITIQITNHDGAFTYNPSSTVGTASINSLGLITISGLNRPGQRFVLQVDVTRAGYTPAVSRVLLVTRLPGVAPNLSRLIQRTSTGFIVPIRNFDSLFAYEAEFASPTPAPVGATISVDRALRRVVVTNLPVGLLASVQVTSSRAGYADATSAPTNPTRSLGSPPS